MFLGLAAAQHLGAQITTEDLENDRILPIIAGHFLGEVMVIVFVIAVIAIVVSVATSASISQAAILAVTSWDVGRPAIRDTCRWTASVFW